jgi:PRC-barrel domain
MCFAWETPKPSRECKATGVRGAVPIDTAPVTARVYHSPRHQAAGRFAEGSLLHKTSRMLGCHLVADDGEVGHVDDLLVEEGTWAVRYLVIDTSNWIGGKTVLISVGVISGMDSSSRTIRAQLTRAQVKASPSIDVADVDLEETLPSVWIL